MSKKLEGKIALVTDGSRGIGAAIAKACGRGRSTRGLHVRDGASTASAVVEAIEREGVEELQ